MSGFLGDLVNKALGAMGGSSAESSQVGEHLSSLITPENVQSLLGKAEQYGLGDKVRSWIGNGDNLPVSVDEIRNLLSSDQIQQLVSKTGLPAATILPAIAQFLPAAVDHHTPDGTVPPAQG